MNEPTNGHGAAIEPAKPLPAHRCVVLIPTTQTLIYPLIRWVTEQIPDAPEITVSVLQHFSSGYVEDARQALAEGFIQNTSADWLLMVDSDTLPKLSARQIIDGAEAAGIKLAAGPTPVHGRSGGVFSNVTSFTDTTSIGTRWHKVPWQQKERYWHVRSAGFACALIHRDVLIDMFDQARKGRMPWPFRAGWRDGRVVQSEDYSFYIRAAKRGFKCYVDLDNPCSHVKHWAMTPSRAIEDLPFHEPTATPHPNAPRDAVDGLAVRQIDGAGFQTPRLVVPDSIIGPVQAGRDSQTV